MRRCPAACSARRSRSTVRRPPGLRRASRTSPSPACRPRRRLRYPARRSQRRAHRTTRRGRAPPIPSIAVPLLPLLPAQIVQLLASVHPHARGVNSHASSVCDRQTLAEGTRVKANNTNPSPRMPTASKPTLVATEPTPTLAGSRKKYGARRPSRLSTTSATTPYAAGYASQAKGCHHRTLATPRPTSSQSATASIGYDDVQQEVGRGVSHAVTGQEQVPDHACDDHVQHDCAAHAYACVRPWRRQRPCVVQGGKQIRLVREGHQPPRHPGARGQFDGDQRDHHGGHQGDAQQRPKDVAPGRREVRPATGQVAPEGGHRREELAARARRVGPRRPARGR